MWGEFRLKQDPGEPGNWPVTVENDRSRDENDEQRGLGRKIEDVEGRDIKQTVSRGKRTMWSQVRRTEGCQEREITAGSRWLIGARGQREGGPHLEQLSAFSRK